MAERPLYTLYKNLKAQNFDVPDDYDRFESALTRDGKAGADNRHAIYQSLKQQNFDVPDTYERFYSALFVPRSKDSSRAKGGDVPMTAADRARFSAGARAISQSAGQTMRNAGRYNTMKQRRDRRKNDFGRVNIGTHKTPYGDADNIVKDDFAYNPETGKAGTYVTSDNEDAYTLPEAQQKQGTLDEYGKEWNEAVQSGAVPSALDEADPSLTKVDVEKKQADREAEYISNLFRPYIDEAEAKSDNPFFDMPRGGAAGFTHNAATGNGLLTDEKARQLLAAHNQNAQRRRLLELEQDTQNGSTWDNHSFWRGFSDALKDINYWSSGVSNVLDASSLLSTKQDLDKGKHTTVGDVLLRASVNNANTQSRYGDNTSWVYDGGMITANMVPFIAQIAGAGFSDAATQSIGKMVQGATTGAAKGAMKKTAGIVGMNAAKNIGKFTGLSTKAFGRALQYGLIGAAQANTLGMNNITADVLGRYTGQVYQDEDGKYKFGTFDSKGNLVHEGGEDFLTSLVKGELAQTTEFATELAGGSIDAVGRYLAKGGKKMLDKFGMQNVTKYIGALFDNRVTRAVDRSLGKVEVNSIIGESMEEELGIIANSIFTGDNQLSDLWDKKQQAQIWGGMFLSIGLMKATLTPFHAYNAAQYYRYKHNVDVADVNLSQILGKDRWNELRDKIDATTNEDMPRMLVSVLRDESLGNNRVQVSNYIKNLLTMRGYDIGTMLNAQKAAEDKGKDVPATAMAQNQAYQQGHNAEGSETHDIQQEYQLRLHNIAQMLGISEEQAKNLDDTALDDMTGESDAKDMAIYQWQAAKARYQGVMDNVRDKVDEAAQEAATRADMITDKSRGTVRNAMMQGVNGEEDFPVYILNGNVATHDNGAIDISDSDKMIIYFDPRTNKVESCDPSRFASLGDEVDASDAKAMAVQMAREQAIREQTRDVDGRVEVGSQFTVMDEDGIQHEYEVLADNGDGTVTISVDGNVQQGVYPSLIDLQQLRDQSDGVRLTAMEAQNVQNQADNQASVQVNQMPFDQLIDDNGNITPAIIEGEEDKMNFVTGKIGDSRLRITTLSQNEDGSYKVTNRVKKADAVQFGDSMSVDDYKQMMGDEIQQEQSQNLDNGSSMIEADRGNTTEDASRTREAEAPAEEEVTPTEEKSDEAPAEKHDEKPTEAETAPVITLSDGTEVKMKEDGNPDMSQLTPEQIAELYDTTFEDDAEQIISDRVTSAKKTLDKAENMKVTGKNFVEQKANADAKKKAIAEAQGEYDAAKAVKDAYKERLIAKEEGTSEGRRDLIDKARRKYDRLKGAVKDNAEALKKLYDDTVGSVLHRLYDGTGIDVMDDVPLTAEEYVASHITPFSLNYEGNENSKGVKQETGLSREDFAKTRLLAKDGKGTTIDKMVDKLWNDRPSNLDGLDTQDIRAALLNLIMSGKSATDFKNYVQDMRINEAEKVLEEQKRAEDNAKYQEEQKAAENEQLSNVSNDLSNVSNDLSNENVNESDAEDNVVASESYEESQKKALEKVVPYAKALKTAVESGDKKAIEKAQQELTDAMVSNNLGLGYLYSQLAQYGLTKRKDDSYKLSRAIMKSLKDAIQTVENSLDSAIQNAGLDGVHIDFNEAGEGWIYADKGSEWHSRLEALDNNYRWLSQDNITKDNVSKIANIIKSQIEEGERYNADADSEAEVAPSDEEKFPSKLREASQERTTEVPEDATDEKPLGEQKSKEEVPFSARQDAARQAQDERSESIEKNRVKDMQVVDDVVGKKTRRAFERIAKMMGATINWQYTDKMGNGWYNETTDADGNMHRTIWLTLDSSITEGAQFIFGHEMTHEMKSVNPASYEEFYKIIKSAYGNDFGKAVDLMEKRYSEAGITGRDRRYYEEEVVADGIGELMHDLNLAHGIAFKMSHPLLARIHDILLKIARAFTGTEFRPTVEQVIRSIEQAYVKTSKGEFAPSGEGTAFSLRSYSPEVEGVNDKFNADLQDYIDGKTPKGYRFELGAPSAELIEAGFPDLPIYMRSSLVSAKAGNEKHPFEASELKNLVKAIQRPIAVFNYTKPNMKNLIVDIVKGNKHFLVGVTLNYKAGDIEINSVSGLFPKEDHEWINWIQTKKGGTIFEKDKVQALIASLRTNPAESNRIGLNLDLVANILNDSELAKEYGVNISENTINEDVQYSLRTKPEPKKKGIGYKVFLLGKDGKLYPPMVANPNGAATPVGAWLDADAAPIAGESKTGRPQVKQGGKGTQGGSGTLAFRPGWHLGVIPYALQFNKGEKVPNPLGIKNKKGEVIKVGKYFPKNFVFAEVEYADDVNYQDEANKEGYNENGKFVHSLAGLKHLPTDGSYMYRTNANPATDPWVITGAMKVNRILTRAEQAELVKKAGREPQQIQEGDIVTDEVVNRINLEIADMPKFSLKVYHGSGADFDEFDFDHMGEGEGSQAFGWGGYVTSSKNIGTDYATRMDNDPSRSYYSIQQSNGIRFKKKYPTLESFLKNDKQIAKKDIFTEQEKIDYYNERIKMAEPYHNLYEVNIPDDNGSNYLDWDAPLSDELIDKVANALPAIRAFDIKNFKKDRSFEDLYRIISMRIVEDENRETNGVFNDDKAASKLLSSLGFTGIKYKAGRNFGGAEKGDTNYVVFKPEDMKIVDHTKFSIRTYHGSQASFDKFDHSFMGSGEGAQAYGWGTYVSEVEGIAKAYAKQNTAKHANDYRNAKADYDSAVSDIDFHNNILDGFKKDIDYQKKNIAKKKEMLEVEKRNNEHIKETYGENSDVYKEGLSYANKLQSIIDRANKTIERVSAAMKERQEMLELSIKERDEAKARLDSIEKPKRNLYTVEIPDDTGDNYIGWDEPMTEKQVEMWKKAAYSLAPKNDDGTWKERVDYFAGRYGYKFRGEKAYKLLTSERTPKEVSLALKDAGFDGVKVIAQRNTGGNKEGKMNYVIFDENNAKIVDHVKFSLRLKNAIAETDTNPSEAQKESGNYKKGHIKFGGYDFTIENPKGSTRSGKGANGKEWSIKMHNTYGYIRGKFGKDGDHLDMFINDDADLDNWHGNVYVVDQKNADGSFDEHKVMYGFDSEEDAKKAYLSNYTKGWKGLGSITGVSKENFDKWVESSKKKMKPFAEHSISQSAVKAPETFDEFLNHPALKFSIRNEAERKAAENAYNFAMENRPDQSKQYAIVDMEHEGRMPEYFEKKVLAKSWSEYYNKVVTNDWGREVSKPYGNYKLFDLDKPFEEQVNKVEGNVPDKYEAIGKRNPNAGNESGAVYRNSYELGETSSVTYKDRYEDFKKRMANRDKLSELKWQRDLAEADYRAKQQERVDYQNQLMKQYMDEHGLSSEFDIPGDVWEDLRGKSFEKYQDELDELFHKYVDLDNKIQAARQNVRFSLKDDEHKQAQLDIVLHTNPMLDDYHTGIRTIKDIKTFAEAVKEGQEDAKKGGWDEWSTYPDETNDLLQDALDRGYITIYSSKPIVNGNFVTPSRMQAEDYSGGEEVYEKTVPLTDVAWINVDEGQYARVKDNIKFSLKAMDDKPEGWKQANKKTIHIVEAMMRDPKFSLKKLNGTLIKAGTYFSGGGLVEEGLKGIIDPVVAVEYDEKISGVYRNNFGKHLVTADVRDVDPKELVKNIDGEVEYFHASPVCKNFSKAKANHEEVELDKETAQSTADFINQVKPKVVTIENVKGYRDSEAMKIITDALDRNGYKWDADVYNAADYGGYTNRERLIVRAVKDGELPEKPKKMARKKGWYEAVEDIMPTLTEKKNGVAPWMDVRLKADGIDWKHIDKPLYVMGSAYANGKVPHAFADELLPTLRTKSGDVIVMPDGKVYRSSGRVLARVSGVSDDYKMPYSEALSHTIIGNGIPTQLTEHVIAPLIQGTLKPTSPEENNGDHSADNFHIRYSLRRGDYEKALSKWKKENNLPKDAKRPEMPQQKQGESKFDYMLRVNKYLVENALWKTAPQYEGHLMTGPTAQAQFNRELQRRSVLTRIAVQDAMLAIRKAQEAIAKEAGIDHVGIGEDAYTAENRSHGKAKNEFEEYNQVFLEPLRKSYHKLMLALGHSYDNVKVYMIAKHGLERNRVMAFRDALATDYEDNGKALSQYYNYMVDVDKLQNDADFETGKIDFKTYWQNDDSIRVRYAPSYLDKRYDKQTGRPIDYAGLTSLFDGDDFEEKAAKMVMETEFWHSAETSELWKNTNLATKRILRNSYDAGMMNRETYEYVRSMFKNYIPLRGWNDTTADDVWDYVGGGKGAFNEALKSAKGRTSLADDPIAYIENMAESGILINNRNWVKQHLLLLAENHPENTLLTLSKAWYVKTKDSDGNEVWMPSSPNIPASMTDPAKIKEQIKKWLDTMERLRTNGEAKQQREGLNIVYPQTNYEERQHEVRVMRNGEEFVIYVNGDPQLAQAINNSRAQRVRETQNSWYNKVAASTGRAMAALYTSMSPLFVPANYFRDLTMTTASTAIREDARYNALLRKNLLTTWDMFKLVKEYQSGSLREKVADGSANKDEKMFYDYMMQGGETGFVSTMDIEDFKKKIHRELKDLDRSKVSPIKAYHAIMEGIEYLNRVAEGSNRFLVYKTSIQYGRSVEEAINDAKDVTLNFNRKGTGEKGWQFMRDMYLFVNPAIQSLQTLGALAKHHPIKFTAVTTAWMLSGMLVPMVNQMMLAAFGGDDDKDKYWQFSRYDRRNNFVVWVPGTKMFLKVPLSQEFRPFYGVGDMIASKLMGDENVEESWQDYAEDLMGSIISMSPVDPTEYGENYLVSLTPNFIRPFYELAFNVDFTGKPLFKDSEFNKYDPNWTKAYAGTPDWLVRTSRMVNSIQNDYPDEQQNFIDRFGDARYNLNNPAVVDHLLSSYLGGAYTLGSQIIGAATKALNDPKDFKTADIPFFSKFVSNPDDRPLTKKKGENFWQDKDEQDRIANTIRNLKKNATASGDFSQMEKFYGTDEYKEYKENLPKMKKFDEERKLDKLKEQGEEDTYKPHQTTAEDIYKAHTSAKDDFEDLKMQLLWKKAKALMDNRDVLGEFSSQGESFYKKHKAMIDAAENVDLLRGRISDAKKLFLSPDGKDAYNADRMKEIREWRQDAIRQLESADKVERKNADNQ